MILEIIAKIVASPLRIMDLPLKVIRKAVDYDEKGALEEIADAVEESIEELGE